MDPKPTIVSISSNVIEVFRIAPEQIDVRALRESLGMSQLQFATAFGLAVGSVRNWEQGSVQPDASITSFLKVIKFAPDLVQKALDDAREHLSVSRCGIGIRD